MAMSGTLTRRTPRWHNIPQWRQDNEYILGDYRPLKADYLQVIKRLTFVSNEACNVYLIGAVLLQVFAAAIVRTMYQYIDVARTDFDFFSVFFCSPGSYLLFSALQHLIGSHSKEAEQSWHRMDLLGIVIVTVGTFVPEPYLKTPLYAELKIGSQCATG
ncbi:uncharacterized protein FFNC_15406 [Fusarium fujikuroi]|nr:uncharacterized protein FFNC_15406 [Fusarium fujikuroi]